MRAFDWNDIFCLPITALAGDRRIPKTVLTRQALLTKTEQKVLDRVSSLTLFATVQKSTTHIPPSVDDEHDIQCVLFLRCELSRGAAYAEVARLVHKCFPNPTVILFGGVGEACISVAVTRKSLAEQGATVIDSIESTGAFGIEDSAYESFLDALPFNRLPQVDLLAYLDGIAWSVQLSNSVRALGYYPSCADCDREQLGKLIERSDALAVQIADIRQRRRDRGLSLNESARLRMDAKKLEAEFDSIMDSIKSVCTLGDAIE